MLTQAATAQWATFEMLSEADCEDWVLRVLMLSRHWRRRHAEAPFFTLGLAAYLDCVSADGPCIYRDPARRRPSDQLLESHFAPLLQTVAAALGEHFGVPARITKAAASPGFHIYLPHPAFKRPVASVHRDLQYRDVFPEVRACDQDVFSFTLPLSTPPGSGLNFWHAGVVTEFFPYRSGQLIVHSGLATHQAVLQCDGELERITLQGHGIRIGQEILLYW